MGGEWCGFESQAQKLPPPPGGLFTQWLKSQGGGIIRDGGIFIWIPSVQKWGLLYKIAPKIPFSHYPLFPQNALFPPECPVFGTLLAKAGRFSWKKRFLEKTANFWVLSNGKKKSHCLTSEQPKGWGAMIFCAKSQGALFVRGRGGYYLGGYCLGYGLE